MRKYNYEHWRGWIKNTEGDLSEILKIHQYLEKLITLVYTINNVTVPMTQIS